MHPSLAGNFTSSAASSSTSALITAYVGSAAEAAGNVQEEILSMECFESDGFVKFQSTVDDLLLAASTASTVFNFLVIYCACKLFKKSGDTMHLFILNMTMGDLLLTIFCHPNEFLIRRHDFLKHIHLCAVIHFGNWLGLAVSGLSLTLLNVDKLIFFCWPFTYNRAMSKGGGWRLAATLCVLIWATSLGFVSYVWAFRIVYATADCMLQMTDTKKHYYELFMVFFCVLPVTSSLVVSTFLFRLIKAKQHAPVPLTDGSHADMKREFKNKVDSVLTCTCASILLIPIHFHTKSLVFIFATTLWTSFSLLPYRIFNLCRIHLLDWHSIDCHQRELMNWLAWILIYLLTLNPVSITISLQATCWMQETFQIVNPIITAIVYAPYRKALRKLLISVPIGSRSQTTGIYRTTTETTTYAVVDGVERKRRVRESGSTDQELYDLYTLPASRRKSNGGGVSQWRNLQSNTASAAGTNEGSEKSNLESHPHHTSSSPEPKQSDSLKSVMTPSTTSSLSKGHQETLMELAAVKGITMSTRSTKDQVFKHNGSGGGISDGDKEHPLSKAQLITFIDGIDEVVTSERDDNRDSGVVS